MNHMQLEKESEGREVGRGEGACHTTKDGKQSQLVTPPQGWRRHFLTY